MYVQYQQTTFLAKKLFNITFTLKADLLINDDDDFNHIRFNNKKKQSND